MRGRVERLVREFPGKPPRRALDGVDLELPGPGVHAVIGPNGSGKTTLLRALALLDPPDGGAVRFDDAVVAGRDGGRRVRPGRAARRRVTMVFERPALLRGTVRWNIDFALGARGVRGAEARGRVAGLVEPLALDRILDAPVDRLSAGEARRASLARALALRTELLLLDEPTTNLDPLSTAVVERAIGDLASGGERTVVLATHDLAQARRLAGRVHFLRDGRIAQGGETADVLDAPRSHALAEFVGVENLFRGAVEDRGDHQRFVGAGLDCAVIAERSGPCWAGIPARDVLVSREPVQSSAMNAVRGTIAAIDERGPTVLVTLAARAPAGGPETRLVAAVTRATLHGMRLAVGEEACFTFKAASVRLFER